MTEDDRRQGERRQGDRREGERRQHHDRKTCIELAKHIGVLSVGLSVIIHGIVADKALSAGWNFWIYFSIVCVLVSFLSSVVVIFMQLPHYWCFEIKAKNIKLTIQAMIWSFIFGAFFCAIFLFVPLFPW